MMAEVETHDCDFSMIGVRLGNIHLAVGIDPYSCLLGAVWQGSAVILHIGPIMFLVGKMQ